MKPYIHAENSARRFGGKLEDYLDIHNLLDSSKSVIADNRHRALTHNSWFLFILERIFGVIMTNSDGKKVSVREIGEQHIMEDFRGRFIPSAQDYLQEMEFKDWMNNGKGLPPSFKKLERPEKQPAEVKGIAEFEPPFDDSFEMLPKTLPTTPKKKFPGITLD